MREVKMLRHLEAIYRATKISFVTTRKQTRYARGAYILRLIDLDCLLQQIGLPNIFNFQCGQQAAIRIRETNRVTDRKFFSKVIGDIQRDGNGPKRSVLKAQRRIRVTTAS